MILGIVGCLWTYLTRTFFLSSDSAFLGLINKVWIIVHFPLYVMIMVLDPPSDLEPIVGYLGEFIQWFLIGQLVIWLYNRSKKRAAIS